MTWAIRGCSGFGAVNGCVFAGVTWGAAWWFLAHDPQRRQSRPYSSGWIILALTVGIGLSGNRGWMQWPSFFMGHLQTNSPKGEFVPIPRVYGFVWLFIAGVPWAGLGACLLAWCNVRDPGRLRVWILRAAWALAMAWLARAAFRRWPEIFLPLYSSLKARYADRVANPNLQRLINDNRAAVTHLGIYLGFLGAELSRGAWRNVTLILTVGVLNGLGWAVCQNWQWASTVWPEGYFNWWRCWESCGGISIGLAYGVAYYLVNRADSNEAAVFPVANSWLTRPNWERFGAYLGLLLGLGLSVRNGLKGWANIYLGNERYWDHVLWRVAGPLLLVGLAAIILRLLSLPLPREHDGDVFPHAYGLVWLVLLTQNAIAQLVTGPHTVWSETAFSIYYLLLFVISAVIVYHVNWRKRLQAPIAPAGAKPDTSKCERN
jgi:hypothetical protein